MRPLLLTKRPMPLYSTVRVVAQPSCPNPNQWREEGGTCYAFNNQEASFSAARRECQTLSTAGFRVTLPVVTSAEEDAALTSRFPGGRRPDE